MMKTTASRLILAFALTMGQVAHAAIPPKPDVNELQMIPTEPERDRERLPKDPVNTPYNDDVFGALNEDTLRNYAGMPVVGLDLYKFIDAEEPIFTMDDTMRGMKGLYLHDYLELHYPLVANAIKKLIDKRAVKETIFEDILMAVEKNPNAPVNVKNVACFVVDTIPTGQQTPYQTLDMLIDVHKCNPAYGVMGLNDAKSEAFKPEAIANALRIARNDAKIEQSAIDDYVADLMITRERSMMPMLLVTYVENLQTKTPAQRRALYTALHQRVTRFIAGHKKVPGEHVVTEMRKAAEGAKGINAYFAAVFLKALEGTNSEMKIPALYGYDTTLPLSVFVNPGDAPGGAPSVRVAPR